MRHLFSIPILILALSSALYGNDLKACGTSSSIPPEQFQGLTPLMAAASRGLTIVVEDLVNRGAEVGFALPDGRTAASMARDNGHIFLAEYLDEKAAAAPFVYPG